MWSYRPRIVITSSPTWDEGTAMSRLEGFKQASELAPEDTERIIVPLSIIEEEERIIRTQQHLLDPDIDEPHIFTYGCARHSSHPGAPSMLQTVQNLIQSTAGYKNNTVGHVNYAGTVEGQRAGGPGTPMLFRRLVFARHGAMPILTTPRQYATSHVTRLP